MVDVPTSRRPIAWEGPVIDTDVHVNVPKVEALFPYLDPVWIQYIQERSWSGLRPTYPAGAASTLRPEWKPVDGSAAATKLTMLQEHVLDPWAVDFAVLSCSYPLEVVRHPDFGGALASAVNDWLVAEWLNRDPRLRASLRVPAGDPAAMQAEIERVGGHEGFVQVHLPVRSDRLYGHRTFHPVFRAVAERDLVLGLHWGGVTEGPPSPVGAPSWYIAEYVAEWQVYLAQIDSLVVEGVFQNVPNLRVAVFEGGFTWFPSWMWRLDKDWKATRRDVPWLTTPPSDLIREHMRFSIAPFHPGPQEQMARIVEWMRSEDLLMFATDYPHHHDDSVASLLEVVPESMRPKIMSESARSWYRL